MSLKSANQPAGMSVRTVVVFPGLRRAGTHVPPPVRAPVWDCHGPGHWWTEGLRSRTPPKAKQGDAREGRHRDLWSSLPLEPESNRNPVPGRPVTVLAAGWPPSPDAGTATGLHKASPETG